MQPVSQRIKLALGVHWESFEHLFKEALSSPYIFLSTLDAYVMNQPGKQLRPILSLLTAAACGEPTPLSHAVASVVEMIHTASLFHDDVADQAEMRRGAWSVQKLFGAQASILLGDYWLSRAFQLLLSHQGLHLMEYYATAVKELSEGELFQMEKAQTLDITFDEYYSVCAKKTASLFVAAMVPAALSVSESDIPSPALIEEIRAAAHHLGLAFQINDDILDYQANTDSGKVPYQDLFEAKITLPLLGAMHNAASTEETLRIRELLRQVEKGSRASLQHIIDFVDKHSGLEYAQKKREDHLQKASTHLQALPPSQWRDYLLEIAGR